MTDCPSFLAYFYGFGSACGIVAFIVACAALSAAKRNRLLIRRNADMIHKSVGTKQ